MERNKFDFSHEHLLNSSLYVISTFLISRFSRRIVFLTCLPASREDERGVPVGVYKLVYDFASKAGSLEGYVYPGGKTDLKYLPQWSDNLIKLYRSLPPEAREEIQGACDETLGRTIRSLLPLLGEDHEVIKKLRSLVKGKLPSSPDDFPHSRR
jgi:hypothetical protein